MQDDSFEDWQMPRPFMPKRDSLVNDVEFLDEGILCYSIRGHRSHQNRWKTDGGGKVWALAKSNGMSVYHAAQQLAGHVLKWPPMNHISEGW